MNQHLDKRGSQAAWESGLFRVAEVSLPSTAPTWPMEKHPALQMIQGSLLPWLPSMLALLSQAVLDSLQPCESSGQEDAPLTSPDIHFWNSLTCLEVVVVVRGIQSALCS